MLGLLLTLAEAFNQYDYSRIEGVLERGEYSEALHLIRINEGLYAPSQLPVIDRLKAENRDYYYLHLSITRRIFGIGSIEAAQSLLSLTRNRIATYQDPKELLDLTWLFPEGDSPESKYELLMGEAELHLAIFRHHVRSPISDFQGGLSDSMYSMMDNKAMEMTRTYMAIRRCINDAKEHAIALDKTREYNAFVEIVNREIGDI